MLVFDLEYILENITFSKRKQFSFCLANSTTTTKLIAYLYLGLPYLWLNKKKNVETNKKLIIMICCMFSFLFFFTYQILIET